eukprot:COSAG01_NODE_2651_length_7304_cov_6.982799_4_plen_125_part_00
MSEWLWLWLWLCLSSSLQRRREQQEEIAARAAAGQEAAAGHVLTVYGDSHCLYRSVACHLNPDIARLPRNEFGIILRPDERPIEEAAAISLRNCVASYMESHWDEFPTVLEEERATRLRGIRGR